MIRVESDDEAVRLADKVVVLSQGGVLEQYADPATVLGTPANDFVADFVGLSNRVSAELSGGKVVVHGTKLDLLGEPLPDGPVTAYIRPEDIAIESTGIPATVASSSFLGSLRRTQVVLADGSLLSIQHDVDTKPVPGDAVFLRLKGAPVSAVPRSVNAPMSAPAGA